MIHSRVATLTRSRWAGHAKRRLPIVGLLAFGIVVLIPNWILLVPDDEGLFLVIEPTYFQAKHLFTSYPFWNPLIGFGAPHPGGEGLIYHPFVLVAHFASRAFSIALLYQVQYWIGLLSVWALCRHLRMNRWVTVACTFTFALCSITVELLQNFWPDLWVAWTLSPLLFLLLLRLLDGEGRRQRAFYGVATGLCAGLMIVDGHVGVVPIFGFAFAAFVVAEARVVRRVWPWLGLAVVIAAAIASSRVYDVALENARSTHRHYQQVYPFDFPHFLFYPHYEGVAGSRNVAFGLPFVVLAVIGLVWPPVARRFGWGIRAGVAVTFIAWFLPVRWFPVLSGNYHFGQPFTLFSILLAGLALHWLWGRFPRARAAFLALVALQMAIVAYGFYHDVYSPDLRRAQIYLDGTPLKTLKNTFKNQEIYRYFEQRPDHSSTRVLMSIEARKRLWRTLTDYQWSAWATHGLRLVNSHVRGADVSEFEETVEALHGEIRGEHKDWSSHDDLQRAGGVLDVLNIGYVLARPTERVASTLVPVHRFTLPDSTVIVAYRNPGHWPDAVVVSPRARQLTAFDERPGCERSGLLCDDLSPIVPLRRPTAVTRQQWNGTTLDVTLSPSPEPRVLMVSQMYRPGWRAKLSDGRTIDGYRLFGGVTGFDIPPGERSAEIFFHPTARIVFAALSWAAIVLSALFLVGIAAYGRRRRKPLPAAG